MVPQAGLDEMDHGAGRAAGPEADPAGRPTVVLADGRGAGERRRSPSRRVLTRFVVGTLLTLVAVGVAGGVASRRLAEKEALADVRALVEVVARTVVEPRGDRLAAGDAVAMADLDRVVRAHLLQETAVRRVKLWDGTGRVLYSDVTDLVGEVYPVGATQRRVLATGVSATRVSNLEDDENRFEAAEGARMIEVYTRVPTTSGPPLLFEAYVRTDLVQQRQQNVLSSLTWVALIALAAFAVSQAWLVAGNLWWLRRERARLAARSAQAVEDKRRQVARDLHDGVVQDLLGASLVVDGATGPLRAAGRPDVAADLAGAQTTIRTSIRGLRSMVIDIYPSSLRSAGLRSALLDLVAPLQAHGVAVTVELPDDGEVPDHLETAVFRAAREALRNVERSARARSVRVRVTVDPAAVTLQVDDDGVGLDPTAPPRPGHIGLRTLADEADALGGTLTLTSAPGRGTTLRLVLPR